MSSHVYNHLRLEQKAFIVRMLHRIHPSYRKILKDLSKRRNIKANIGCGFSGLPGWVNFDLLPYENLTLCADVRWKIPLANESCVGIHVEHFFEHLSPDDERPRFLRECYRCLQPGGVLRVIVPDAKLYISAYERSDWEELNRISCGGDVPQLPQQRFRTKMEALNHVFLQDGQHYGGYDAETLALVLEEAGFSNVIRQSWRQGDFPGGAIDRDHHRPYSLYFEGHRGGLA
jgi:predicted SAM-dependent methyltransferase